MFFAGAIAIIAAAEEEEVERRIRLRQIRIRRKQIRDTSNPFELDPEYFRKLYRLTPHSVLDLIDLVRDHIMENDPSSIPVHTQVCCALRFFAEGGYQKGAGQDHHHPVSQSTFSRCLTRVTNALVAIAPRYIQLPSTREERQRMQQRFRQYIRIPGVLGLIDCVLVSFIRPCQNEEAFYNHKGFHAMNVQIISDADFLIRSIRICPGSNNDRFVWRFSDAKQHFETLRMNENVTHEEGRYYILGDSGYTPSPVLLTPVRDAVEGSPEAIYTQELVVTRCRIEQLFGHLTAVWRSIKRERKLCYRDPQKVAKFITACAVLHNFRRMRMIDPDVQEPHHDEPHQIEDVNLDDMGYQAGLAERNIIIQTYYN